MNLVRVTLTLALSVPSALAGQSVLGSTGLGMRLEPLDAVERALGGLGVTTRGATVLPGNPVASLDVLAPTIAFTIQPQWGKFTVGSDKGSFSGTTFPVLGFAYPLGTDAVVTFTAGSQFDQNWSVQTRDSISTAEGTVGVTDTFVSDGGVTAIQAGYARHISSVFSVGVTLGVYRGGLTRSFGRTFDRQASDSTVLGNPIESFEVDRRWSHSGLMGAANVAWDPLAALQLGATLAWGGTVNVNPESVLESSGREVSVPLEVKVSALAALSPALFLQAGISTSDWSDLSDDPLVNAASAGRVMTYGAGLEWDAINFWAGALPLRFGYRHTEQPFRFLGKKVKERTFSFGFSVVIAQNLGIPLAAIDLAFELGNRRAGDFNESLRRITVSTRVGGL
jgi:hypothetical protein